MVYSKLVNNGRSLFEYQGKVSFHNDNLDYLDSPVLVQLENERGPVSELSPGENYMFRVKNYQGKSGYWEADRYSDLPTRFKLVAIVEPNHLHFEQLGAVRFEQPGPYRRMSPPIDGGKASFSRVNQDFVPANACFGQSFGPCQEGFNCVQRPTGYTCINKLPVCLGLCGGKCLGKCVGKRVCQLNKEGEYECVDQESYAKPVLIIIFALFLLLIIIILALVVFFS